MISQILTIVESKAFDVIHKGKMEQIILDYGLPKETVAAIMMLYKNTEVKVRSTDGDIDYFDIEAGVLQRDTLAPYLLIICLDYVLNWQRKKAEGNLHKLLRTRTTPMT